MDRDLIEHFLGDSTREAEPPEGSYSGTAGGAPCGDLMRISIVVEDGRIAAVTRASEGCAVARAASAAVADAIDGLDVIEAARIDEQSVSDLLGGLAPTHWHAAELAVDSLARALSVAVGSETSLSDPPSGSERVLLALSGGVDSGLAAVLAQDRGAEVAAVTLKLWQDPLNDGERSCCSPEAVLRARRLAHSLGLAHFTLDLRDEFDREVVGRFNAGYASGRTPNPCVICNGDVRIDAMIDLADRIGATHLVTGHYARVADDGDGPLLARPGDLDKDQTHMLAKLEPESVARLELPLADLTKAEVRRLAAEAALPVAAQPESQDLCFLAGEEKVDFLRRHGGVEDRIGDIVTVEGEVIGTHRGHHRYTVGQRRGLGLGGGTPLFVLGVDAEQNRIIVGPREQLAQSRVHLSDCNLYREMSRIDSVRLRSHQEPIRCSAMTGSGPSDLELDLVTPALGVAPGQSATLYSGDLVVGQGTIEASPLRLEQLQSMATASR